MQKRLHHQPLIHARVWDKRIKARLNRELILQEKNDWEATLDKARTSTVLHTNTIAACEQAIDKIVYQLFDLTAEEIAVVEGKRYHN